VLGAARKRLAELLHLADGEGMFTGVDGNVVAVVSRSVVQAA